jgi:hypothetical protein
VKAEEKQELRRYVAPLVVAWVVLLAAGIVYFSVLGLAGR